MYCKYWLLYDYVYECHECAVGAENGKYTTVDINYNYKTKLASKGH